MPHAEVQLSTKETHSILFAVQVSLAYRQLQAIAQPPTPAQWSSELLPLAAVLSQHALDIL